MCVQLVSQSTWYQVERTPMDGSFCCLQSSPTFSMWRYQVSSALRSGVFRFHRFERLAGMLRHVVSIHACHLFRYRSRYQKRWGIMHYFIEYGPLNIFAWNPSGVGRSSVGVVQNWCSASSVMFCKYCTCVIPIPQQVNQKRGMVNNCFIVYAPHNSFGTVLNGSLNRQHSAKLKLGMFHDVRAHIAFVLFRYY